MARKLRQEMAQEVQKAYQEARTARQQELQANERQGLLSSIEWGLELKFGEEGLRLFNEVQQIHRHASVAQDEPTFGDPRGAKVRQRLR